MQRYYFLVEFSVVSLSGDASPKSAAEQEGQHGEHKKDNKQNLRYAHKRAGDSAKPQYRRYERDHKTGNG
jgi:hypothetical protein